MSRTPRADVFSRNSSSLTRLSIGAVLVLASGTAQAQPVGITSVSASPSSVQVDQSVTISVKGSGGCSSIQITYGDGKKTKHAKVDLSKGPLVDTHSYKLPGAMIVQAKGSCPGEPTTQVQVAPKPSGLQPSLRKDRPIRKIKSDIRVERADDVGKVRAKPTSTIEKQGTGVIKGLRPKIWDLSSEPGPRVRPGADLKISGIAFGDQEGSVYIHGTFNNSPRKVKVLKSWSDTEIVAQVPVHWGGAFGGVCGWTIEIEVRSAKNVASYPGGMVWAEQHRKLSWKDKGVVVTSCSFDGNIDMCNGKKDLGCSTTFKHDGKANPELTIDGLHYNCPLTTNDGGYDKYAITLPTGWVFDKLLIADKKTSGPGDSENFIKGPNPAFPAGKTTWKPVFNWGVTQDDWVHYKYLVRAKSPETCPWPE